MRFYLGTHQPQWLREYAVPMFVSRNTVGPRKTLPVALGPWALDSGAFTELQRHGRWTVGPREYAEQVRRIRDGVGGMEWAAIQDWMCEPIVISGGRVGGNVFRGTRLSVPQHQALTVRSLLDLMSIAPDIPWAPVVQGWEVDDYLRHAEDYARAGVDLRTFPVVGVGSICRRQATDEAVQIIGNLWARGLRLHAFGLKLGGLPRCRRFLVSADSMAWSYEARNKPPLRGCRGHINCANCPRYAMRWLEKVNGLVA